MLAALFAFVVVVGTPTYALAQEVQDNAQTEIYLAPSEGAVQEAKTSIEKSNLTSTGDTTPLLPLALIGVSAALVVGVVVARKVKVTKQNNGGEGL